MSTYESASESSPAASAPLASVPMKTAGVAAWLLAVVLTAIGTFTDIVANDSEQSVAEELPGWLVLIAVLGVVTFVVFRYWFTPAAAAGDAPNTALVAGILAAVTVVAFWSGLPEVFGVGAIVLGLRSSGWKAKVGIGLGVIALGMCVLAAIVG